MRYLKVSAGRNGLNYVPIFNMIQYSSNLSILYLLALLALNLLRIQSDHDCCWTRKLIHVSEKCPSVESVPSDSIFSPCTDSGPDCVGCSAVIREEEPPAEGCVFVNTLVSL